MAQTTGAAARVAASAAGTGQTGPSADRRSTARTPVRRRPAANNTRAEVEETEKDIRRDKISQHQGNKLLLR